ncbi:RNA polymerase sigma factor [Polyangium aurulentum]|uniref:RNA polymerase sigma factor n=1 Tax=Polyangium aurulentum TaxID=2567896 RepID=UPI0010AEA832|nr:sigma factor [Polyangium aurulentum]UQA57391.1 sigma-70 family RNA polymerase sigma factor [Polyangium aurulentum]
MSTDAPKREEPLADPALRQFLLDFVRRRVSAADADDIVQTVLCEALVAKGRPEDATELRKYLLGIARHKVADAHRRSAREEVRDVPDLPEGPAPVEEASLLRWAEKQAPATEEAQKTLAWMAREGEGEKLETIAAEEKVPAARVRQRVSRMRRWMKERWLAELAAVAALAVAALVLARIFRREPDPVVLPDTPKSAPLPHDVPLDRARALRAEALRKCEAADHRGCIDGLDEARRLDPAGDLEPAVQQARERAQRALDDAVKPLPPETKSEETRKDTKSAPVPKSTVQSDKPAPNVPGPKPQSKNEPTDAKAYEGKKPAKKLPSKELDLKK